MRTFDIYKHPTMGYQAVKQGFSWPAFFFVVIWAFVKKMYWLGFILLVVNILANSTTKIIPGDIGIMLHSFISIGLMLVVGAAGNDWRRNNLQKRGFEKLGSTKSPIPEAAINKFRT